MKKNRHCIWIPVAVLVLVTNDAFAEVTPFTVWTVEARSLLPVWVQYWVNFMFLTTFTGLFFIKNHVEARWGVGAFVTSHLASGSEILIFGAENFVVGMIAINHCIFWTPAAIYLARKLKQNEVAMPFSIWHFCMLGVFVFSLIFDYRDAFIYLTSSAE